MASGFVNAYNSSLRYTSKSTNGNMINPTSRPDVNSMAMNVKSETGIGPVQRTLRHFVTNTAEVSSVMMMAMVRIKVIVFASPPAPISGSKKPAGRRHLLR